MYVRPPDPNRQRIKIPENYSGHAFRECPGYTDMPPPTRIDLPPSEKAPLNGEKHNDNPDLSPQDISRVEETDVSRDLTPSAASSPDTDPQGNEDRSALPIPASVRKESPKTSLFSSLFPVGVGASTHFPFGHGIGSEEMLILAMMLLVFLSTSDDGGTDNELMLLLGLLLFAG